MGITKATIDCIEEILEQSINNTFNFIIDSSSWKYKDILFELMEIVRGNVVDNYNIIKNYNYVHLY